jgi:hypothetical protein
MPEDLPAIELALAHDLVATAPTNRTRSVGFFIAATSGSVAIIALRLACMVAHRMSSW